MVRISEIKLLKILLKNARLPFTQIGALLGVSESAIRKKIKTLEKKKIILGYNAKINFKKIGFQIDTLIGLDPLPENYIYILELLKKEKNILQLWTSTGDHMIMFRAIFKNNDELTEFIKKYEKKPQILKVCPAILVEEIK